MSDDGTLTQSTIAALPSDAAYQSAQTAANVLGLTTVSAAIGANRADRALAHDRATQG